MMKFEIYFGKRRGEARLARVAGQRTLLAAPLLLPVYLLTLHQTPSVFNRDLIRFTIRELSEVCPHRRKPKIGQQLVQLRF